MAASEVEGQRSQHPEFVFTFRGKPVAKMNNTAFQRVREIVRLKHVRIHDLKHTFGRRLRAAGMCLEDRQDLLGHRSGRITTHYSQAGLANLLEAANRICGQDSRKSPALVILEKKAVNG